MRRLRGGSTTSVRRDRWATANAVSELVNFYNYGTASAITCASMEKYIIDAEMIQTLRAAFATVKIDEDSASRRFPKAWLPNSTATSKVERTKSNGTAWYNQPLQP